MKISKFITMAILALAICSIALLDGIDCVVAKEQAVPSIITKPVEMTVRNGAFQISSDTQVIARGEAAAEALKLIDAFAPAAGFRLKHLDTTAREENLIILTID